MLVSPSQYLDVTRNLRAFTNVAAAEHTIGSDIHTSTHGGITLSKETSEGNPAIKGAFTQGQDVIRNPKVISREPRRECNKMCEHLKARRKATETCQRRERQSDKQRKRLCNGFENTPHKRLMSRER